MLHPTQNGRVFQAKLSASKGEKPRRRTHIYTIQMTFRAFSFILRNFFLKFARISLPGFPQWSNNDFTGPPLHQETIPTSACIGCCYMPTSPLCCIFAGIENQDKAWSNPGRCTRSEIQQFRQLQLSRSTDEYKRTCSQQSRCENALVSMHCDPDGQVLPFRDVQAVRRPGISGNFLYFQEFMGKDQSNQGSNKLSSSEKYK